MRKSVIIGLVVLIAVVIFGILLLINSSKENLEIDEYDYMDDGIILMQHEVEGFYGCFGCGTNNDGIALCIDPALEMKMVEEMGDRYCGKDFEVVENEVSVEKEEGEEYSKGFGKEGCEGTKIKFDYAPVNLDKTELLVPLGLMTGGHVTPIDHQYFQDFSNTEVDIEVYSPGDGFVTSIQHMPGALEGEDFRLVIQHTCTISSIYIHIDKLTDKLYEDIGSKDYVSVSVPVEAGETIGWYKTNVDYNLVDEEVLLTGLLVPEHYEREPWKIHVPNTLDYFNEPIRSNLIEKSLRIEEPIAGRLDWDVDGKLRGNWFEEGTNYYAGSGAENYWITQISISPDYLDYDQIIVSMGQYDGKEAQFAIKGNFLDPADVGVETGLVKYELTGLDYYTTEGDVWDRTTLAKIKEARSYDRVSGVVLVEMIEDRRLKFEAFPGKSAGEVSGFTNSAKIYER